jgi:hypothetical protein
MAGIFISYRREDSAGYTGRLYDLLSAHFGAQKLFVDLDSIQPGEDFPAAIERNVASCDVLLAIIGTRWLSLTDNAGISRLQDPQDFVRREIAAALERGIKIIPLLVGGAKMPQSQELPGDLARIAQYQAFQISDTAFHQDVSRLIDVLRESVKPPRTERKRTKKLRLRSEKGTLSVDDVKVMLAVHGFFCRGWNEAGKGIRHEYKTMAPQGGLVVFDSVTNLMWQKGGSQQGMVFDKIDEYILALNSRPFAGFDDWRVPTLEEAMSLMNPAKDGEPHLDPEFDGSVIMWTADRHAVDGYAWIVYFSDGLCSRESVNYFGYVRAVRSRR